MNAPIRARKVARPSRPIARDEKRRERRTSFFAYHVLPVIIAGAFALSVLAWHVLFGAGTIGLVLFLGAAFLSVVLALVAVSEWIRFERHT